MGRQGKQNRKTDINIGKGKVSEVQVAFIVDQYLSDNNFHQTRSTFRLEGSSLLSKSPVLEAPKNLLSLGAMLNEYVSLKEQKVMLDQEKVHLELEKSKVQTLLQSMQAAMNAYNAGSTTTVPATPASSSPVTISLAGCPPYQTPMVVPASLPSKNLVEAENLSLATTTSKRKETKNDTEASSVAKRTCNSVDSRILANAGVASHPQPSHAANVKESSSPASAIASSPYAYGSNGSGIQNSRVAKCLFNQAVPYPWTTSASPTIPLQGASSPTDKCTSAMDTPSLPNCSYSYSPQKITPIHCTVISSKTVTVSPCKQGTIYSMQRNQIINSPAKTCMKKTNSRDHVKGKLNFDSPDPPAGSDREIQEVSTSASEKEVDLFGLDFLNIDAFGPESFSDLLNLGFGGTDFTEQSDIGSSPDNAPQNLGNCGTGASQITLSHLSTDTDVPDKGSIIEGTETLTSMNAMTKRIQILSPAKKHSLDRNCSQ